MNNDKSAKRGIKTTDIVYCGMFASLMAVGAFIKIMIPIGIWEVTFSLQFFFALLAGFLLGSRRGLAAVGCYLLIGLAGVPVFAHGGGLMYLMKPTFGFLIGFAAAAYVAGRIGDSARKRIFEAPFRRVLGRDGLLPVWSCILLHDVQFCRIQGRRDRIH